MCQDGERRRKRGRGRNLRQIMFELSIQCISQTSRQLYKMSSKFLPVSWSATCTRFEARYVLQDRVSRVQYIRPPSQRWVGRAARPSRMRAAVPGFTNLDRNVRSISIGGGRDNPCLAPLHRKRAEMKLTEQCTVAQRPSLITVAPPVCLHAAAVRGARLANDNIR